MCDVRLARSVDLRTPGRARSFLNRLRAPVDVDVDVDVAELVLVELLRRVDGSRPATVAVVLSCHSPSLQFLLHHDRQ